VTGTWRDEAVAIIGQVHADLPADADVKARKRALNAACPHHFRSTSHGRKTWGKAATAYLLKHGMKPRGSATIHLSPLERLMAKAAL
jgi:hypothetical protein